MNWGSWIRTNANSFQSLARRDRRATTTLSLIITGAPRFELGPKVLETHMLPLHHAPILTSLPGLEPGPQHSKCRVLPITP